VDSYLSIYDALLPTDDSITAPRLWHIDLHAENIFVDRNNHSKIVGIIDWQGTDLVPLLDQKIDPAFIEYDGAEPETLERPVLEDTGLEGAEKVAAVKHYYEKALSWHLGKLR
jgi:aminoglycoside phosphotransferase (APT) family kinase protein